MINKIRELYTSLHQPQDIVFARIAKKDDFRLDNRLLIGQTSTIQNVLHLV